MKAVRIVLGIAFVVLAFIFYPYYMQLINALVTSFDAALPALNLTDSIIIRIVPFGVFVLLVVGAWFLAARFVGNIFGGDKPE